MVLLFNVVNLLFQILSILVLIRVLLSWIRPDPYNPIVRTLIQITDPILLPFQRLIPPIGGMDFSPIIALIALELVRNLVVMLLI